MRGARIALVLSGLLFAGAAGAQIYDPSYPVCMQIYSPVGYFDCRYDSLAQCRYLAVGRSASCVVNPYFVPQQKSRRRSRPATQAPTPRSP
jgi:hypothetical protein